MLFYKNDTAFKPIAALQPQYMYSVMRPLPWYLMPYSLYNGFIIYQIKFFKPLKSCVMDMTSNRANSQLFPLQDDLGYSAFSTSTTLAPNSGTEELPDIIHEAFINRWFRPQPHL